MTMTLHEALNVALYELTQLESPTSPRFGDAAARLARFLEQLPELEAIAEELRLYGSRRLPQTTPPGFACSFTGTARMGHTISTRSA